MKKLSTYAIFTITVFLSSFLLFLIQPLISKYLLPWFGGGPMIWTTALVFFQIMLLAGYSYAHLLSFLKKKTVLITHSSLLALSLLALPMIPDQSLVASFPDNPSIQILLLLLLTIGLPYLLLSSSSPLLQNWFGQSQPKNSPYTLYATSNTASLLALLLYPFFFESLFKLSNQSFIWSALYLALIVLTLYCLSIFWKNKNKSTDDKRPNSPRPSLFTKCKWVAFPAIGSLMLIATSTQISIDIAPTPFLWILPLAIYLITFIFVFSDDFWYGRKLFFPVFILLLLSSSLFLIDSDVTSFSALIASHLGLLFLSTMICHGETARIKPAKEYITSFYLYLSFGGALGGIFGAILAPNIFTTNWELIIGLMGTIAVIVYIFISEYKISTAFNLRNFAATLGIIFALGISASIIYFKYDSLSDPTYISRNFYGTLEVKDYKGEDGESDERTLTHGSTLHGSQFMSPDKQRIATTYYGETSGIQLAIDSLPIDQPHHIGVIGLGTGTIAAYGDEDDTIRFYEIDKDVITVAQEYFQFYNTFPGQKSIVLGDARLSLEAEASQQFDILAIDAFSSDAIPTHLLTKEAFQIYLRHMKEDGIISVHTSNRVLNLEPVVFTVADELELEARTIEASLDAPEYVNASTWVIVSKEPFPQGETTAERVRLWTDDYTNLLPLIF